MPGKTVATALFYCVIGSDGIVTRLVGITVRNGLRSTTLLDKLSSVGYGQY